MSIWTVVALFSGAGFYQAYQALEATLERALAAKFDEPRIRQTLEEVASSRASQLLEAELRPELEQARVDTKSELATFRKTLEESRVAAEADIATLKRQSELYSAMTKAESDDRAAFDRLEQLGADPTYPDREAALRAWVSVLTKHSSAMTMGGFKKQWPVGVDGSHLQPASMLELYWNAPVYAREWVIESIEERKDWSKPERMELLLTIAQRDPYLPNVERAGRAFAREAGVNWKPLAVRAMTEWWAGAGGSAVRR